jgi:hypothetical protein
LGIENWEFGTGSWKLESQSDKKYCKNPSKINNILSKNDDMNKKSLVPPTPSFYGILNQTELRLK